MAEQRRLFATARDYGLSPTEMQVLIAVTLKAGAQAEDIRQELGGVERSTVRHAIRGLRAAGLLTSQAAGGDGRLRQHSATAKGRRMVTAFARDNRLA